MHSDDISIEEHKRSPIWYIVALFILLLMVVSFVPYYGVRLDPRPTKIPTIQDIIPSYEIQEINKTSNKGNYNNFLKPNDPLIKQVGTRIATFSCSSNVVCQAKTEYYFVRDNFIYVSEYDDYIQNPEEMLGTRGGDCDDHAVLLANLLRSIGIHTEFVHVPRHVFIKAYIPEAPRKYQTDGWVYLDPTCKHCEFGEIPYKYTEYY